jgi:hypothetical protein
MESYINSEEWGPPTAYDIIVTKEGTGLATKYTVMVGPKEPLDEGIITLYRDMAIDLTAYFRGEDPFGRNEQEQVSPQPQSTTSGVVHAPVQPVQANGAAAR